MLRKDKPKAVQELKSLIQQYPIIGIVSIEKLPTRQLQTIKKRLGKDVKIKVSKQVVIRKAIEESKINGWKKLIDHVKGSVGIVLAKQDPFKLFMTVKKNKTPAPAKPGDIAKDDIMIKKGQTSLPPGPAITQLQNVGLKTKVEGGKIHILEAAIVVKKGEKISSELASVFTMLGIEPMEIGLNILCLMENGIVYEKDVLDIDLEEYVKIVKKAITQAFNLSININYPTKLTISTMIQKAFNDARSLSLNTDIIEKEFIKDTIGKAIISAKSLEIILNKKEVEK